MQLCRTVFTDMPGMSVWPGTHRRSIPAHRRSGCHRNKVAVFIFMWARRSWKKASLQTDTVTSVFLQLHRSSSQQPLISVFPLRCRAGAYACTNALNTSPPLSFAMPSAISSSHSSPVSSRAAGAALQHGEQANPVARAA